MNMNNQDFIPCKAKYISSEKSIFFKTGAIYDAFIPKCNGGKGMLAFYFGEDEMDEEGYYAMPVSRFEIVDSTAEVG